MASADVQTAPGHTFGPSAATSEPDAPSSQKHDVRTALNYYLDPGNGSLPPDTIVGRPETVQSRSEPLQVTVHDIRGEEDQYTLDKQGFQLVRSSCTEKTFDDDERIRKEYYPEVADLLKKV